MSEHTKQSRDRVLAALDGLTDEEKQDWLRTPKLRLESRSPLEALRDGSEREVLALAEAAGAV
jgi:uncharacterized protein (DUF2384 family)